MRLHLIRHPQPEIASGLCYGSADVKVAPERLDEAAGELAAVLPRQAPLYSSPLARCARLSEKLFLLLGGSPPIYDARLAEMNFGNWEMQSWDNIPRLEVDAWVDDLAHFRPGGGETVTEVAQRVLDFDRELGNLAAESVIIVCHAGTIRLLLACRHEKDPERVAVMAALNRQQVDFGSCITVDY